MKPILKYPGAKWQMSQWIVQQLPRMPRYVEPFCGSAAIFFNLPWRPRYAVLNDLSGDIVNLFRVMRESGDELASLIDMTPWARDEYELSYQTTDNNVERARRFVVRTCMAHSSGIVSKSGWRNAITTGQPLTDNWKQFPERIRAAAPLLKEAMIENAPACDVIRRYNGSDVLIYADPPYVLSTRSGNMYQYEMNDDDHIELLECLNKHIGPVVLSGYESNVYSNLLSDWQMVKLDVKAEKGNTRTEVLWLNEYAIASRQTDIFIDVI